MIMEQRFTSKRAPSGQPGFRREVGLLALTFVSLGSIIGSGWLLGALNAAEVAGPASIISWVLAAAMLSASFGAGASAGSPLVAA